MKDPYFAIKVLYPSGRAYWFTDRNDNFTLAEKEESAKVFLTQGSADRYIQRLIEKNPNMFGSFRFQVVMLGTQ